MMTDEQIRERCKAFVSTHAYDLSIDGNGDPDETSVRYVESLCREMIAEGMERALAKDGRYLALRTIADCNIQRIVSESPLQGK